MNRREAIAKATIETAGAADALLDPEQSQRLVWRIKERLAFSNRQRTEMRRASAGEINKAIGNARIIRRATENTDDGYRAGVTFESVAYSAVKIRLPWEVTEDVFHENISGEAFEQELLRDMEQQWALDWEDLEWNGDTAAGAGPDQDFLTINDGLLKAFATAPNRIDGSTINAGALHKSHFFEAKSTLPNRYRTDPGLVWAMSPNKHLEWIEFLTDRATGAGDAALLGGGTVTDRPLNIPIVEVPSMPDTRIVLLNPRNVVRVVTWDVRRRRVTGETDKELAATDKRFYVLHVKTDVVVEEDEALVDIHTLTA